RGRRVSPLARRLDPRPPRQRLRGRRAVRAARAAERATALVLQRDRAEMGVALARRGSVGGAAPMREVDSISANIAEWTETNAQHTDESAKRAWDHEG